MIYHILALLLLVAVSFILSTLMIFALMGFDLSWDLLTSRPAGTAAGRDGQFLGCMVMLILVFSLTIVLTEGGVYLLEPYIPKLPSQPTPIQQRFSVPYTQIPLMYPNRYS